MNPNMPFFFDDPHRRCVALVLRRIVDYYGTRLVSLAVFGSYARGQPRLNSDLDLLLILEPAAWSRLSERTEEFDDAVEQHCDRELQELFDKGIAMELSPIILTRNEAESFMPIYLDMANDCVIIEDRDSFLGGILEKVKERMGRWGSRRVVAGCSWVWEIRPGLKWNEVLRYDE